MSWPASSARSTCGRTVSSKPTMPGKRSPPSLSRCKRLSRSSALTVLCTWPDARNSPIVAGVGEAGLEVALIGPRYVGGAEFVPMGCYVTVNRTVEVRAFPPGSVAWATALCGPAGSWKLAVKCPVGDTATVFDFDPTLTVTLLG